MMAPGRWTAAASCITSPKASINPIAPNFHLGYSSIRLVTIPLLSLTNKALK